MLVSLYLWPGRRQTCAYVGTLLVFFCLSSLFFNHQRASRGALQVVSNKRVSGLRKVTLIRPPSPSKNQEDVANQSRVASGPPSHFAVVKELWATLQPILEEHEPPIPPIAAEQPLSFDYFDHEKTDWIEDLLRLKPMQIVKLRDAHERYIAAAREAFPEYRHPANAARRGIVISTPKSYFPIVLVGLRMLRWTGTTMGVEVWINRRDEYEEDVCERVLPQLNAQCHVMEDIFLQNDSLYRPKDFTKFEYKVFALLFSSFQQVLLLDADNILLHPPEELFDDDPFRRTGMVMWPDLWFSSVSPTYYLINGRHPHHRGYRSATETGQMMFDKRTHFQTLLLAAYYNYYGETHYYTIFCQNGPGRGDKETYIPAAETLGLPYWQVQEPAAAVGHNSLSGAWNLALIQWHPVQDFHLHRLDRTGNIFNNTTPEGVVESGSFDEDEPPRMLFLHCNGRKWNPRDVLDFGQGFDLAWDAYGNATKAYNEPSDLVERLGWTERMIWDEVRWVACESQANFLDWEGKQPQICDRIARYYDTYIEPQQDVEPYVLDLSQEYLDWVSEEGTRIANGEFPDMFLGSVEVDSADAGFGDMGINGPEDTEDEVGPSNGSDRDQDDSEILYNTEDPREDEDANTDDDGDETESNLIEDTIEDAEEMAGENDSAGENLGDDDPEETGTYQDA